MTKVKNVMVREIETIEEFLRESFKIQEDIESYNNGWEAIHHKGLAFRGHSNKYYDSNLVSSGEVENFLVMFLFWIRSVI